MDVNDLSPLVPSVTEEDKKVIEAMQKETTNQFPPVHEHPLADRVEELKMMAGIEDDPNFYEDLKTKDIYFYSNKKQTPNAIAKKYHPDLCRRFIACERRIKKLEDRLWALPKEDRSLEEDRFEILTELLDKACQGLEIWDEHAEKNILWGHRLVLEARLVGLIDYKFDIIDKICDEFHKLKGDRDGVNNEREWLRYEIRQCDMMFYDINEKFLLSYLDMDW